MTVPYSHKVGHIHWSFSQDPNSVQSYIRLIYANYWAQTAEAPVA